MSAPGRARRRTRTGLPLALVLSPAAIENVRPLALAGIPTGLVVPPDDPARCSRAAHTALTWDWTDAPEDGDAEVLLARLLALADRAGEPAVLLPCGEASLSFCSRHRRALGERYRFLLPEPDLVESVADKARFAALAAELGLPVPRTSVLPTGCGRPPSGDLEFPVLLKPPVRGAGWPAVAPDAGKALLVGSRAQLDELWPRLCALGVPLIAQEHLPGPESLIESYHVYVGVEGGVLGEFTGAKIRTLPAAYGHTTALTVGHDPEVVDLGRDIVSALGLRGVAKLDFKRDRRGRLTLLEVNARFSLWHHAGARAGVNLPALAHADLTGRPLPAVTRARSVAWYHPSDLVAARAAGLGVVRWLRHAAAARATAFWAWDDPLPLLVALASRATPVLRAHRHTGRGASCATG